MKRTQAHITVFKWTANDAPQPTANQLIRSVLNHLVNGYPNDPYLGFSLYGGNAFELVLGWSHTHALDKVRRPLRDAGRVVGYEYAANLDRAKRLWSRYARFCQYMTETRHNWQSRGLHHYMDNSVEEELVSSLTGQVIRRMVTAPSGDVCF